MTLVAKISIHAQQICGLAWSLDGDFFASRGNDDICCLFDIDDVLGDRIAPGPPVRPRGNDTFGQLLPGQAQQRDESTGQQNSQTSRDASNLDYTRYRTMASDGTEIRTVRTSAESLRTLHPGSERHC